MYTYLPENSHVKLVFIFFIISRFSISLCNSSNSVRFFFFFFSISRGLFHFQPFNRKIIFEGQSVSAAHKFTDRNYLSIASTLFKINISGTQREREKKNVKSVRRE